MTEHHHYDIPGLDDEPPIDAPVMEALIADAFPEGRSEDDTAAELAAVVAGSTREAIEGAIVAAMVAAMPDVGNEVDRAPVPVAAVMLFLEDRQLAAGHHSVLTALQLERAIRRVIDARNTALAAAVAAVVDALEPAGGWRDAPMTGW